MAGKRIVRPFAAVVGSVRGGSPSAPSTPGSWSPLARLGVLWPAHDRHRGEAPWAYSIDKGIVGGKRVRHVVTAASKRNRKARDLRRRILAS